MKEQEVLKGLLQQPPQSQSQIQPLPQQQECHKKKEFKWTEIIAEQESISDYIMQNLWTWDTFPLTVKIQVLDQFYMMIESANLEEDDIVLRSNCNFIDQLKHNNPKIVQITLKNIILYTQKAQSIKELCMWRSRYGISCDYKAILSHIHSLFRLFEENLIQRLNYNVPNLVSQLISKVMIRKEFRDQTIQLFMLIFAKCRDGLNYGIQEIFSSPAPKPICETLCLFELMLVRKEGGMKDFLKQYLPQIYVYTQNQYQEVRSQALKLFVCLMKEYGESFVASYKTKLKSNQIDFVNKQMQLQKEQLATNSLKSSSSKSILSTTHKKQLSNQSSQSNLSKYQQPTEKVSILSKQKTSIKQVSNNIDSFKKRDSHPFKSKEDLTASMNDLSKSRSSINSKVQKKKYSDTLSQADYEDSSYDKCSEISSKNPKEIADSIPQLNQLKKVATILDRVVKADLPEILETENKKQRAILKVEIGNREKKASSVYKKEKSIAPPKKGETGLFSSKPPLSQSSSQSSLGAMSKKFKSEQELKLKKSPLEIKALKIQKARDVKQGTPNGIDDESYYANPVANKFSDNSQKTSPHKNSGLISSSGQETNTLQYSFSQEFEIDPKNQNKLQNQQGDTFLQDLLHLKINNKKEEYDEEDFKDKFASNDSSIQLLQEETPFGVDHMDFYAEPNPDYNSDEEEQVNENPKHADNILDDINNPLSEQKMQPAINKQDRAQSLQDNQTPQGVDCDDYYAEPNQEEIQADKADKIIEGQQEETQEGDAMIQSKQNKNVDKDDDLFVKKRSDSQKQKSRTSVSSNKSTPNEDIQKQKEYDETPKEKKDDQIDDVFQSIVINKQNIEDSGKESQNKFYNNLLHVVEEESQKQSGISLRRQLSDVSLQMSFYKKQNQIVDSNEFFVNANSGSNHQIQCSEILKLSSKKESHFASEPNLLEEEDKQNHSNFYHFQDELSNHQQSQQQNNNKNNYEIRGYFFNQDLKDILSVVESAEHKNYFFNQNKTDDIVQQNKAISSNANDKIKKKPSVHQQRSSQPSQSPHKQPVSHSLQRNAIQDEEREQAKQTIIKASQMNDQVLKSYIFLFNNKLVNKLFQAQKDKIIYIINKDNVNQWFNSQEYDNVGIISFFILFIGKQFEKEDIGYLSRFWNFQKFLSFNNALIQSETINVMHQYFKVIQKHNSIKARIKPKILRDTINKLIKIIPVSRDKLFDESFAFIDFLFELDIYNNYIFDAISEVLQSNVPKQTVSSLRILSNFLKLYGEKRLNSLKPFMYIIKSISFSANLQVRNAAIEFYQEAYSWMGDAIFEYTKALKKSQLIQLEKAFSQVILKERRPLKCPEDVFCPIMNDDLFEKQQNIFTSECDEEIQKQESFIRKALAVQEWVNKDDLLEKIVNDASNQMKLKEQNYSNLITILLELLGDWNKYLIENTLILIRSLSLKLKKDFSQGSIELFEAVFELYSEQKSINRDKISKALVSLFIVAGLNKLQKIIQKLLAKKRYIKELLNILNFGLRKSDVGNVLTIIQDVQIYLTDKDSNTKIAAFDLFGMIRYLFGNPIIDQNLNADIKNNRFILQKIQESHVKCAKMKSLSMQKKQLEELKQSLNSNSYSTNSEMSTASYDKQYFYVQLQNCSFSSKKSQVPIQQFKIQKKQELLQKQQFEEPVAEIFQGNFVHEFLSESQKQIQGLEDIDEI